MGIPGVDPRPNPPAHTIRLEVGGQLGTAPFANGFWARNPGGVTPSISDLQAWASYTAQQWVNQMDEHVSTGLGWTSWSVLYYGSTGADLGAEGQLATWGQQAGLPLPANVAACISWSVQQHYRGGHPRTYVAGLTIDQLENPTTWKSSVPLGLAQGANGFRQGIESATVGGMTGVKLGVVSFILRKEWRDPPVFRDYVPDGAHVDDRVDSQRRRLGRDR